MLRHETKGEPEEKEEIVVVEAYGARKCPKLIEQVLSVNPVTRRNALAVLCDEMHNPISICGCVEAGMVEVLNNFIVKSEDSFTKELSSRALALAALDSNGRTSMLETKTAYEVAAAIDDRDANVRKNVYEALVNFCRGTLPCIDAVVQARYPLVSKAESEAPEVQPLVLQLLYCTLRNDKGLETALESHAVRTCIALLASTSVPVRKEAATTLGFLCFAEAAKQSAIAQGAVSVLCHLLDDSDASVRAAVVGALTSITTTDEGKLAFVPANGVEALLVILARPSNDRLVTLNLLKLVANVAVHPAARDMLRDDPSALRAIGRLEIGDDRLVAKHAAIAKGAVSWEP